MKIKLKLGEEKKIHLYYIELEIQFLKFLRYFFLIKRQLQKLI